MTSLRTPVGAELNLRSQMLFLKPPPANASDLVSAFLAWNNRYIHECGHWARLHGTSIGILLTHLRRARDQLATYLCRQLDAREVRRLSRARQDGTPLLSWDRSLIAEHCDTQLSDLGEAWLMHRAAYDVLFDPQECEQALRSTSLSEATDLALLETWQQGAGEGMLSLPRQLNASVVTGRAVLPSMGSSTLSTRLLFECASTLDELYPLTYSALWRLKHPETGISIAANGHQHMLAEVLNGEYGLPWTVVNRLAGREVSPFAVHTLIDFALNPPIPGLTRGVGRVEFQELYPPTRFVAAARCLIDSRIEQAAMHFTDEGVEAAHAVLSELTGLRTGTVDCELTAAATPRAAVRTATHVTSVMPNAVFTVARRILQTRDRHPHRISHFGFNFVGEDVLQFLEPGSEFSSHWLHPLLRVADNEYLWPTDLLDIDDASILFEAIAMSAALDEVVSQVGLLNTGHLPLSALHAAPGAADQLSADLQEMIQLKAAWPSQ